MDSLSQTRIERGGGDAVIETVGIQKKHEDEGVDAMTIKIAGITWKQN